MKKLNLIFITLMLLAANQLFSQVSIEKCVSCNHNTINYLNYSSAVGIQNTSNGLASFATGKLCSATGSYSVAMGYGCNASANYSFAFGQSTIASQNYAFSLGKYSESTSAAAFSLGTYLTASDQYSMVIGKGYGYSNRLENDLQNTLMIGFNSQNPTFFVGTSPNNYKTGEIGIGNITAPQAKLHILGDSDASRPNNASLYIQSAGEYYSTLWLGDQNHYIKTKPNEDLLFNAANENFIFESGNVGIGTNTPGQKLEVAGTIKATAFSGDGSLLTNLTGDNLGNHILTQNLLTAGHWINNDSDPNQGIYIDGGGRVGIGTGTPGTALEVAGTIKATMFSGDGSLLTNLTGDNLGNHIATQNINLNGKFLSGDGDAEGIYINNLGKIGVGTTSPVAQIQANGGVNDVLGRFKSGYSSLNIGHTISGAGLGVWGTTYIGFNLRREANNLWKTEDDSASNGATMIYGTSGGDLVFTCISNNPGISGIQEFTDQQIKDHSKMILRSDGLLKVKEAVVKTDVWSDYVLHDDYPLLELSELAEFITKNHHLPDVPSEAQVMEEGINLGQMDAILLKKIEELTLYVIELKRENEEMRFEIENFKR